MKLYRPKSFLILLLAGFIFVALPLLAALAGSAYFMEKMAVHSTQAVFWSADSARDSRSLLEQLVEQERQARIYDIFAEPENLQTIREKHEKIQEILTNIGAFPFTDTVKSKIRKLETLENTLFNLITDASQKHDRKKNLDNYRELNILAQEIQEASYNLMFQETETLQKEAFRYQKMMLWLTSILFFVSLLLISIFAYLLIRPIRQIDKSILRLGEGDFVTPVFVSGPKDLEFLGTKLDWLRERLAELEKEKNKFVAHISHELKTPLASIREGTGLLSEEVVGPLTAQQKEVVKILTNNSRLLQKLIENIVNFNMAQARHRPPKKKHFALDQLICDVVDDHKPILLANDLHLQQNLMPTSVKGDMDQIRTVIDNILSNAIKHSPTGSDIAITLQTDMERAILDICDRGPGVPEEERSKIFRPFFQGQTAQKGRVKGTGLGLAIAREYMANHHGTIDILPDEGNGAHFRLSLPIEEAI
ncbi:MAG: ATP-binding protein [Thermodesulfobacteriota bacterium]